MLTTTQTSIFCRNRWLLLLTLGWGLLQLSIRYSLHPICIVYRGVNPKQFPVMRQPDKTILTSARNMLNISDIFEMKAMLQNMYKTHLYLQFFELQLNVVYLRG